TGMYNVLEALREGRELTAQERTINEQGLIGILKEIHDQLDVAVAEAYGWPANLGEQDILSRLVALNAERVEEEKEGKIRYLRPDYQNPSAKRLEIALSLGTLTGKTKTSKRRTTSKVAWPSDMPSQVNSVRQALARLGGTATVEEIAVCFKQISITHRRGTDDARQPWSCRILKRRNVEHSRMTCARGGRLSPPLFG
ncbi:MAG: hypothetical protein ACLSHC_17300, partial [Bilophila wadsworthia]